MKFLKSLFFKTPVQLAKSQLHKAEMQLLEAQADGEVVRAQEQFLKCRIARLTVAIASYSNAGA